MSMPEITVAVAETQHVRVLALGDCNSNTIDPHQGTVPAALRQLLVEAGYPVELSNVARGMETCREGLARLLESDTIPDIAVINYGLVDAWTTSVPRFYVPYYPDSFIRKRLRKFVKYAKRWLSRWPVRKWVPRGNVVPEQEFRATIERMISLIRQRNSATVLYLWGTVPVTTAPSRNAQLLRYNDVLREIAVSNDAVFIDSTNAVQDLAEAQRHLDGVHLSPAAARLIGQEICTHYLNHREHNSKAA